jgi:hypothetical protein
MRNPANVLMCCAAKQIEDTQDAAKGHDRVQHQKHAEGSHLQRFG